MVRTAKLFAKAMRDSHRRVQGGRAADVEQRVELEREWERERERGRAPHQVAVIQVAETDFNSAAARKGQNTRDFDPEGSDSEFDFEAIEGSLRYALDAVRAKGAKPTSHIIGPPRGRRPETVKSKPEPEPASQPATNEVARSDDTDGSCPCLSRPPETVDQTCRPVPLYLAGRIVAR